VRIELVAALSNCLFFSSSTLCILRFEDGSAKCDQGSYAASDHLVATQAQANAARVSAALCGSWNNGVTHSVSLTSFQSGTCDVQDFRLLLEFF